MRSMPNAERGRGRGRDIGHGRNEFDGYQQNANYRFQTHKANEERGKKQPKRLTNALIVVTPDNGRGYALPYSVRSH